MENKHNYNGSILLVEFITLFLAMGKFTGYWQLSWLWVFAPMWIPLLLIAIVMVIGFVAVILNEVLK